jgi:hypothetical protein
MMTHTIADINRSNEWPYHDDAPCKEAVRKRMRVRRAVDTPPMRSAIAAFVIACAAAGSATTLASTSAVPALRLGPGPSLTVVGNGFVPRALVRVRVVGAGIDRRASVRAGSGGAFVVRFAGLERCSVDGITATAAGARARVPTPWLVRECPPPPPLAPGVY